MKTLRATLLGLTPLFLAGAAVAQGEPPPPPPPPPGGGGAISCSSDAECPLGATCQTPDCPTCDPDDPACEPAACTGVCVAAPPPGVACTTDSDCADDQFCAVFDCPATCDSADPDCVPVDCPGSGVCSPHGEQTPPPPPSCTTDADCGDGTVCITQTVESCASEGCACPDNGSGDGDGDPTNDPPCECPPPSAPDCTTETVSFCGPRWLDECATDADCGPGFTCEQAEDCTCSIDSAGNESCDCSDAPTSGACQLVRVECTDAADCSDGFVCVEEAATEPCATDEQGNTDCGPPLVTRICVPPDYVSPVDKGGEGETRNDDDTAAGSDGDGDGDDAVDDTDDGSAYIFNCAQGGAGGALPLAALALLLRRRRPAQPARR
ncbi:MAG: hypothetical protein FJ137_00265 [Deltaproteobacteria bacterium]|nr:hypothetical protein [Deltaproteobacteria bacterium]